MKVLADIEEKDDALPYLALLISIYFSMGILAATLDLNLRPVIVGSLTKMPYLFYKTF